MASVCDEVQWCRKWIMLLHCWPCTVSDLEPDLCSMVARQCISTALVGFNTQINVSMSGQ